MKGGHWALLSIILVSTAQLLLRYGMLAVPAQPCLPLLLESLLRNSTASLYILSGLCCYGLSLLFWTAALSKLPLSRAYPLLSLSYIIVWLAALILPGWHEQFSWRAMCGVLMIMLGVMTLLSSTQAKRSG